VKKKKIGYCFYFTFRGCLVFWENILFEKMSLDFDALNMVTGIPFDPFIGERVMTFPGVWSVAEDCVVCKGEQGVEAALASVVAQHAEKAGDPVTGSEACQMALSFSVFSLIDMMSFCILFLAFLFAASSMSRLDIVSATTAAASRYMLKFLFQTLLLDPKINPQSQ
jgi:hypothetical protein